MDFSLSTNFLWVQQAPRMMKEDDVQAGRKEWIYIYIYIPDEDGALSREERWWRR
jgi:hypothetical protein